MCALYVGPVERDRLLFSLVDEGLRNGDKVSCLTDGVEPSDVRDRVAGRADHPPEVATPLDVERAPDVYLRAGEFDVDLVTQVLIDSVEAAVAGDFALLRTVREMSWVLARPQGGADLLLHESAVNRVVAHLPTVVMCLYDLTTFGADMLVGVLRTHATVLLDGAMVDNPYFVDRPEQLTAAPGRATTFSPVSRADEEAGDRWKSLTHAELRVASHVSRGTTNRTIAADLQVSHHTVDAHLKHIYLKLHIHSRVELTVLVLQHQLAVD